MVHDTLPDTDKNIRFRRCPGSILPGPDQKSVVTAQTTTRNTMSRTSACRTFECFTTCLPYFPYFLYRR